MIKVTHSIVCDARWSIIVVWINCLVLSWVSNNSNNKNDDSIFIFVILKQNGMQFYIFRSEHARSLFPGNYFLIFYFKCISFNLINLKINWFFKAYFNYFFFKFRLKETLVKSSSTTMKIKIIQHLKWIKRQQMTQKSK